MTIPQFAEDTPFRDILGPAMEIARRGDHDEARTYLESYVEYLRSLGKSLDEAVEIAKVNIGYYAGYYDAQTRLAVEEIFGAVHPVFGYLDRYGRRAPEPTPEEAFRAGQRMAQQMMEERE